MGTDKQPLNLPADGTVYTMEELRRLDPSGSLAKQARRQLDDLSGLIERTKKDLAATPRQRSKATPPPPTFPEQEVSDTWR